MFLARLRLYAINAFIAAMLAILAIDALPQTPVGVQLLIQPTLTRLGIYQGTWTLFAPDPDRTNTRLRAEITYRDGERATWTMPDWRKVSAWEMFVTHRRRAWWSHIVSQGGGPTWEPTCRYLARQERPEMPDADHGAEVRLIYREALIPPADQKPWPSMRQAAEFDEGWILTSEKLE